MPTNKVYVGSSTQGHRRVFSHTRDLDKGRHSNSYLQSAWDKYGAKSFEWHVVEQCSRDELLAREQWWIVFLRAADRRYGFNLCFPVTDKRGEFSSHLSLTQIEKWRDPEIRVKRLTGLKALHKDPVWKSDRARAMAARWQDPAWRAKMVKVLSANVDALQGRMNNEPGFKQHRMRGIQPIKSTPTGRV
jgi:hypothetical protein